VFFQERVLGDVVGKDAVGGEIAAVEGEEEVAQPGVLGFVEGVEDRVEEEFTEVVDGVGD
jgi:hypothetical protein